MTVVKLGGSLLSQAVLAQFLELASQQEKGVVIVPGGGVFADQVRCTQNQWQYDDTIAHSMAILAMQQMALLFKGLCPDLNILQQVRSIQANMHEQVIIWSPLISELDTAGIPANWDVTSDTLAAWLAEQLSIEHLILVKSAQFSVDDSIEQLSDFGIIDASFTQFVHNHPLAVDCISAQQIATFSAHLKHNA